MKSAVGNNVLADIIADKRGEIDALYRDVGAAAMADRAAAASAPRDFAGALAATAPAAVIGEIKKASPSKGLIRTDFDVTWLAERYAAGGAACLSVLTDCDYFQGRAAYLAEARHASGLPALRKDFMLDPIQIDESRALGADCILLIVATLTDAQLIDLAAHAEALGMAVLAEVHDRAELERVKRLPETTLVGVNNRDLTTFETTLTTSETLATAMPADRLTISESGIHNADDRRRLQRAGFGVFLVGESFMRQPDPATALEQLLAEPD
ncbi:indole-3-glycerol phosphate synthase TrpC [Salinisphaera sp. USBA-960]|uniref:indole-3-glycerol phosphate synthase TrpC n=1 Tax=Salinisphaera orenii TaxID=856731 RepID=UPI000DBE2374|nr:indole-3-glycerol phosphate synthase TrpC [Salifodinibacter halophilus]NNC25566.1 indole-3-glycerol phosphate synthase TrpC [Salifodinibacter halophilus]